MAELRRYDDDKALALMDGAATVARIVRTNTVDRLSEKRFEDWSAIEVIAHLTDTAEVFAERVRRALEEDTPRLQVIPPGRLADSSDPMDLAKRLGQAHARIVAFMQVPGAAERPAVHSEWGPVNAGHIATYQADHTRDHVAELAAAFPPAG